METRALFAVVVLLLQALVWGFDPTWHDPPQPSEAAFQLKTDADAFPKESCPPQPHDVLSAQVWYFMVLDDENDIQLQTGPAVNNKFNEFFVQGQAVTSATFMSKDGPSMHLLSEKSVPSKTVTISKDFMPSSGLAFKSPASSITVISPNEYHVDGNVIEGNQSIVYSLDYKRVDSKLGAGWVTWDNVQFPDFMMMEQTMTYSMQMPNARVSGVISVLREGAARPKIYEVRNQRGYHDGFFGGASLISGINWDWLVTAQDDIAIQMLHPHGPVFECKDHPEQICTPGNLRVIWDGVSYLFQRDEVKIQYEAWNIDPLYPKVPYPTKGTIFAKDHIGNTLLLHTSEIRHTCVFYNPPWPLPNIPTFEAIAWIEGSFYDATYGRNVTVNRQRGFWEYSDVAK